MLLDVASCGATTPDRYVLGKVPMRPLRVPGHGDATIVPPIGDEPREVVVILHGSWDRPEWVCEVFATIARGDRWLLCLRGVRRKELPPDGPRWTLGKVSQTEAEIDAALTSLRERHPGRVKDGLVLAGFSKGAGHAERLARNAPDRFGRVLLVEGGQWGWHKRASQRFARSGKVRVAFGCGTDNCRARAEKAAAQLRAAGVAVKVGTDLRVGHAYNPPFEEIGRSLYGWLGRGGGAQPEP